MTNTYISMTYTYTSMRFYDLQYIYILKQHTHRHTHEQKKHSTHNDTIWRCQVAEGETLSGLWDFFFGQILFPVRLLRLLQVVRERFLLVNLEKDLYNIPTAFQLKIQYSAKSTS